MNTKVVNLFGGPGIGKSTTSALLFGELKMRGYNTELVREYVKDWAWENKKVGKFDQLYITGKQAKKESSLYGKVDLIVTDSPIILSAFYEELYTNNQIVRPSILKFLELAKANGVTHHNFFLTREKLYNPKGRYETEEQARNIDITLQAFLNDLNIPFEIVSGNSQAAVQSIIAQIAPTFGVGTVPYQVS